MEFGAGETKGGRAMTTSNVNSHVIEGYLRREQAAAFCGVSLRTLAQWQRDHLIPFVKVSHRVCLFKKADLQRSLDRFTVKAAGDIRGSA